MNPRPQPSRRCDVRPGVAGGAARRRPAWAAVAAVLLTVFAFTVGAPGVEAHASLVASEPAANAVLPVPPAGVQVTYSEGIVPSLSSLEVLDADGRRVDRGDATAHHDARVMTVSLEPGLPAGVYTVVWRNVSDVDGHPQRGSFIFSVGEGGAAAAPDEATPLFVSPLEPVARWVVFIGLMLLVGVPFTWLFVLASAVGGETPEIARRMLFVAVVGGVVAIAGSLLHLAVQAGEGRGLAVVFGQTAWGRAWLVRVACLVAAAAALEIARRSPARGRATLAGIALGVGALAAVSAASHAAATQGAEVAAAAVDFIHLAAAAVWGGGLVALLLLIASVRTGNGLGGTSAPVLSAAVPRFSVLGLAATFTLAVTGLYSAWLQVTVVRALETAYGQGVLLKAGLLLVLVLLAAFNLFWVRPRLSGHAAPQAAAWLRRVVALEVVFVALALLVAAGLASTEPARQVQSRADAEQGIVVRGADAGLDFEVRLEPGDIGANSALILIERDGTSYEGATFVGLSIQSLDRDLGTLDHAAQPVGEGRYRAEGVVLSVGGQWQGTVLVRRTDGFDARFAYRFEVGRGAGGITVTPAVAWRWAAVAIAVVGAALILANVLGSRRRAVRGETLGWAGGAALALAVIMLSRTPTGAAGPTVNPILPDAASIAAGRAIYEAQCLICHGETTRGDGPQAASLTVPPADLTYHVPLHSTAELYASITEGIPARGMPSFRAVLSDEQIWNLLNYLSAVAGEESDPRR